jgi:ArsR family transcriptional regulator, arsenate/arsenite/antimonite-responsive transcriptional repressor
MDFDIVRKVSIELPVLNCCVPLGRETLSDDDAAGLERLFRVLADRTRVKIVNMLVRSGEPLCVCTLVPSLGLAQPTVSYHLKQLADAGLVERERRGNFAFYRLADGALERLSAVLAPVAVPAAA